MDQRGLATLGPRRRLLNQSGGARPVDVAWRRTAARQLRTACLKARSFVRSNRASSLTAPAASSLAACH